MDKKVYYLTLCALLMVDGVYAMDANAGRTIYVNGSYSGLENGSITAPFNTIAEAIVDANAGDTVYVYANGSGSYTERLVVNKSINIRGDDPSRVAVDGNSSHNYVQVDGSPVPTDDTYTIEIEADDVNVSGLTVKNGPKCDQNLGCDYIDLYQLPVRASVIFVNRSNRVNITRVKIENDAFEPDWELTHGIAVYDSSDVLVSDVGLHNNTHGIVYYKSANGAIVNNTGSVYLKEGSHRAKVRENRIINRTSSTGLTIVSCNEIEVEDNEIEGNWRGIFMRDSHNNQVKGNRITRGNSSNMDFFVKNSRGNRFVNNVFTAGADIDGLNDVELKRHATLPPGITKQLVTVNGYMQVDTRDVLDGKSVHVRFYYSDDDVIGQGLNESTLTVKHWNDNIGEWENVTATLNASENSAYFNTTRFSVFAVAGVLLEGGGGPGNNEGTAPPSSGGGGGWSAPRPKVILLANSVDHDRSANFSGFLKDQGINVIHVTPENFSRYRNEKFIVILGGPDAYEGMGEIVTDLLTISEIREVRTRGSRGIYVRTNVWRSYGQTVMVIAGSDRRETEKAGDENRGVVKKRVRGS